MTNPLAKKKSLQAILSSFTKVVEDLKVLQQTNEDQIVRNDNAIEALQKGRQILIEENQKAASVEAKINSLLE